MRRSTLLTYCILLCASPTMAASVQSTEREPSEIVIRKADGTIGELQPIDESQPFVRRELVVEPNIRGLAIGPGRLGLPLADGTSLTMTVDRFDPREGFSVNDAGEIVVSDDPKEISYYWHGTLGTVSGFVTVVRGGMSALFYGPDFRYIINDVGNGRHVYRELSSREVDAGRCAAEEVSERLEKGSLDFSASVWQPALDHGVPASPAQPKYFARASILFYYTDAALLQYGNDVSALTLAADALVDQLNQSLTNTHDTYYFDFSRVGALVDVGAYVEQPTAPPITDPHTRFQNHLNAVHNVDLDTNQTPRRATEGADLAVLLVNDPGEPNAVPPKPVYGIAIIQKANCFNEPTCQIGASGFRDYGHAAVSVNPMVANFTFSHEVGHMLGGQHDPTAQYPTGPGAYSYSYGHRVAGVARDIMADPECITTTLGTTCTTRQPQYANPNAVFIGTSTLSGSSTRDISRTIMQTAEGTGNIYPLTDAQVAPDIFWSGFEY